MSTSTNTIPKSGMPPEMQKFIATLAALLGKPEMGRVALETLLEGLMTYPEILWELLSKLEAAGSVPAGTRAGMAAYCKEPVKVVSATIPVNTLTDAPTPEPAAAPKRSRTRAAPSADAAVVSDKPASLSLNGTDIPVKNWREVFITLTNEAISAGKAEGVPPSWFRDVPDPDRATATVAVTDGRFLYLNINVQSQVQRVRFMAGLVGGEVKTSDGTPIPL